MTMPELPWDGGCRCGAVRLQVTEPPLLTSACHCTGCQSMTASAFSLTVTVPESGFAVTRGEPVIGGLHGPQAHHHHCPRCKSWLYTTVEPSMGFVNVRPGTLDDHGWFAPFIETWTSEALPWAKTPALKSFETQPELEAYEDLVAEYRKHEGRGAPSDAAAS